MDTQTIICPECKKEIPLSEALKHQIKDSVLREVEERHALDIQEVQKTAAEKAKSFLDEKYQHILEENKKEIEGQRERNKKLIDQLSDLNEQVRKLMNQQEDQKLENQKKIQEMELKIREETSQRLSEEHRLKDLEKDKKLQDAIKANEDLRRKLEQGSQQTQGEVLELDLEAQLKAEFPLDEISEVKKGQRGADIHQIVKNRVGHTCGVIIWETKNGAWQPSWVEKFKQDVRNANANLGVLVSQEIPPSIGDMKNIEGTIWVSSPKLATRIASILRSTIIHISDAQKMNASKDERMEALYQYLISPDFRHRVEAIIESYSSLQADMEKEKRWFSLKWAREEKSIRSVIDNTIGMYGELQGVTNSSLPAIRSLELPVAVDLDNHEDI